MSGAAGAVFDYQGGRNGARDGPRAGGKPVAPAAYGRAQGPRVAEGSDAPDYGSAQIEEADRKRDPAEITSAEWF
jgi:hypothetical protein